MKLLLNSRSYVEESTMHENHHNSAKRIKEFFIYFLICIILLIVSLKLSTSNFHPELCRKLIWKETTRRKTQAEFEIKPKIGYLMAPNVFAEKETVCNENKDWNMVTFVSSAVRNFERRDMIRNTWASIKYLDGARFHTVFVVGKTDDENDQNHLKKEHKQKHDLLQIEVQDTYMSLANKSLAAMQWAIEELPKDFFFTKMDDDVLVDMKLFKTAVDENLKILEDPKSGWPQFPILCTYSRRPDHGNVVRNRKNKNFVSFDMYRWSGYPSFCRGPMYTTRMDTVADLYKEALLSTMLHTVEDAWVTGVLRQRLGMPDDMLIKVRKQIAHHFDSFKNTTGEDFVNLWNILSRNIGEGCVT